MVDGLGAGWVGVGAWSVVSSALHHPYGYGDIEKPVAVSFIGTVNDEGGGFLNDLTGNRRYAVATITKIDWSYTQMDVDDIWRQAFGLYTQGEPWLLTAEEACRRDEINATYQQEDTFEAMIAAKFEIDPNKADSPEWAMTTPDILWYLDVDPTRKDFTMRVASVLKGEGLEKDRNVRSGQDRRGNHVKARFWRGIKSLTQPQGCAGCVGCVNWAIGCAESSEAAAYRLSLVGKRTQRVFFPDGGKDACEAAAAGVGLRGWAREVIG